MEPSFFSKIQLKAEGTASVEKLMSCMISKYRYVHQNVVGKKSADNLNREGIRRRINWLLNLNGFSMRTPKIIDARRCIRFETLLQWFTNKDVVKALTSVHPLFLFNADETEINRKGGAPGKVACEEDEQPCMVVEDLEGSHVSLFLVISAAGEAMDTVVIHGTPHEYLKPEIKDQMPQLHLYETANGYMDKACFKRIMRECFIPFVIAKRQRINDEIAKIKDEISKLQEKDALTTKERNAKEKRLAQLLLINQHAVLITDGHKSMYDPETVADLHDADIDLLIIPAHSSHILQPLDLRLNGLVKQNFCVMITHPIPFSLKQFITRRAPPKKKARLSGEAGPEPLQEWTLEEEENVDDNVNNVHEGQKEKEMGEEKEEEKQKRKSIHELNHIEEI